MCGFGIAQPPAEERKSAFVQNSLKRRSCANARCVRPRFLGCSSSHWLRVASTLSTRNPKPDVATPGRTCILGLLQILGDFNRFKQCIQTDVRTVAKRLCGSGAI